MFKVMLPFAFVILRDRLIALRDRSIAQIIGQTLTTRLHCATVGAIGALRRRWRRQLLTCLLRSCKLSHFRSVGIVYYKCLALLYSCGYLTNSLLSMIS